MIRAAALLLLAGFAGCARAPRALPALLPAPQNARATGGDFRIDARTAVRLEPESDELRALAEPIFAPLRAASGFPLPYGAAAGRNVITLRIDAGLDEWPEGYLLRSTPDSVVLRASTPPGLARGLQTLRQLLPVGFERALQRDRAPAWGVAPLAPVPVARWTIAGADIEDTPRFAYRGLHLDVGRHFFPVSFIKEYIDLLAMHRMSVFHWHLTEDQGWRIEIRQYPELTRIGGCRAETMVAKNFRPFLGDGTRYCGWYTQDEVREVVAYAAARHITVIPEIELPGHSRAATAAYPELACEAQRFDVVTTWGVFEPIFCPSEQTFTFLENVLTEVLALFPGPYIHIGGDEAPKNMWKQNAVAQEVMRREGLKTEEELQSWFIRRIERFLRSHGRRLIGWDEILEGGLAPDATVMSWRGTKGGIEAAKAGHDVVMAPTSHVYLDYYQGDPGAEPLAIGGFSPLEKIYAFEPVPAELTAAEALRVLGAQGNVWTEYIRTREHVEYMAYPRAAALSEVVWTAKEKRDYEDFLRRLGEHLRRFDMLGLNYRIPDVRGLPDSATAARGLRALRLELESVHPDASVHYTIDGSEPTPAATRYTRPATIPVPAEGLTLRVRSALPNGRMSTIQTVRIEPPR